jgi:hypothetical protein
VTSWDGRQMGLGRRRPRLRRAFVMQVVFSGQPSLAHQVRHLWVCLSGGEHSGDSGGVGMIEEAAQVDTER